MTRLLEEVRTFLPPDRAVREVRMFGGWSVMLEDRMLASVRKDGSLLVRVDPTRAPALLAVEGAQPAAMAHRTMGPGWIAVSAEAVSTPEQVGFWLIAALEHHAAQADSPG